MKTISVIIPVFRVEKYISAALESVLAQTYKQIEILVVDDGSPDRSVKICQQFTDPRIKIISQTNRGLAGARNTGIRHAQGDYIALLDGDDMWLPNKLEKHIEHLESSPTVGVSFSRSALTDEAGNLSGTYLMPKLKDITPPDLLCDNPVGNGSSAVIRKEVFKAIQFQDNLYGKVEDFYFDEHFRQAEDVECWLRILIQTNWQIEGIPEALTLYRVNSGGLSASLFKQLESLQKVIEKTRSYAPELIAKWENPAKAYHLRYLARSAVRLQSGSTAVKLINSALVTHPQLVFEQSRRTIMILVAAYLLWLLPRSIYGPIDTIVTKITGVAQRRGIYKD